ncbi:hypothetical protein J2Z42_000901 [Clostridium algifaecis]|uniref:Spore coat associated protein CotJA n=1 Tax=Clostridium algifaecis TaxID=1472040 RepID=A0ABS4KQC0_9CLOT|nr:spore coat associated protein CotJA [Clostridium algifaecis]MBP2032236.1 hypothetical protein [Clostridium algifaecis]
MYTKFVPYVNPGYMPSPAMLPRMNLQLARAYILPQPFVGLLPLDKALKSGTIFPNLVKPYMKNRN